MRASAAAALLALTVLLLGSAVGTGHAETASDAQSVSAPADAAPIPFKSEPAIEASLVGRVAWVTALVLAVACALAFGLRKRLGGALPGVGSQSRIQILEVRRVSPGATLMLVGVDDREILIGQSKEGFAALHEHPKVGAAAQAVDLSQSHGGRDALAYAD